MTALWVTVHLLEALDFFVIGAPKCGTTSLWRGMDAHPGIWTPADKERGFFNSERRYSRGMPKFVHEVFPGADGEVLGTVTPDYMAAPELDRVVPRMAETSPDARLIAILRDPLERAISDFRQELRRGLVLSEDFGEHIGSDDKVLRTSEYGVTLTRYLEYFRRDQLLVVFTSEFEESPQSVYDDIFRFLGVKSFTPPTDVRLNVGGSARVRPEALDEIAEEAMRLFTPSREQE